MRGRHHCDGPPRAPLHVPLSPRRCARHCFPPASRRTPSRSRALPSCTAVGLRGCGRCMLRGLRARSRLRSPRQFARHIMLDVPLRQTRRSVSLALSCNSRMFWLWPEVRSSRVRLGAGACRVSGPCDGDAGPLESFRSCSSNLQRRLHCLKLVVPSRTPFFPPVVLAPAPCR